MSGYIGNIPVPQATQTRQSFTATASQTTFNTAGYSPGYIDVFLNGVKLAPADYTATNGSDVVLAVGAASGDILETVAYEIFQVLDQDFTGDFTVDGSTFVVDSTNDRVGVGTASPSGKLDVIQGTTPSYFKHGTGTYLNITTGSANGTVDLKFDASSGSYPAATFYTGNTERMRITSSGNVGIGTTSPSQSWTGGTARTVQLQGPSSTITALRVNEASDTYGDLQLISGASNEVALYNFNNGAMRLGTNGAERMRIDSSGNVGIGTNSPDQELHIKVGNGGIISSGAAREGAVIRLEHDQQWESGYGGSGSDFLGALEFATGDTSTGVGVRAAIKTTVDSYYNTNSLVFYTAPAATAGILERMRLTTNGQLLLGTTSGTVYYNSVNTYNASAVIKTNLSNEVADLVITNGNNDFGSAVEFARTNSAGNDVRFATISAQPTNTTAGTEAGVIRFYTKNTTDSNVVERMRIQAGGGISFNGDTAAANALDDYEEGTWNPAISSTGTIGTWTPSYNTGRYIKVGNLVHVHILLGGTYTSGTGSIVVTGFPFSSNGGSQTISINEYRFINLGSYAAVSGMELSSNSTVAYPFKVGSSVNEASVTTSDWGSGGTSIIWASGTYTTT